MTKSQCCNEIVSWNGYCCQCGKYYKELDNSPSAKENEKIAVLAGSLREFDDYCKINKIRREKGYHFFGKDAEGREYKYVSRIHDILGWHYHKVVRIGTFGDRHSDYQLYDALLQRITPRT